MSGTLYLVGTPIGNLGDVTERARETMARVDVIACEDTRRTRKLLTHLGVKGPRLVSFFEGNERERIPVLVGHLQDGRDVALVTDAGMPGLSDPGYLLVEACAEEGVEVDVIPGPSAAVAALVVSGLPADRFAFEGFLPRKAGAREGRLAELASDPRTLVFFESPRRLKGFLEEALEAFGDRRGVVVRELTKAHQEVRRGLLSELAEGPEEVRGEVTVVIEGAREKEGPDLRVLGEMVNSLMAEGLSRRDAAARVAEETSASRRAVYQASLEGDG